MPRLTRAAIAAFALTLAACSPSSGGCPAPISGGIELGPQWTELTPPKPLESRQMIQQVRLELPEDRDVDFENGGHDFSKNLVRLKDGRAVSFEGSLRDDTGGAWKIASATGMRIGEIKHLKWSDVDFQECRLSVTAKEGWTPKTCHERVCYVSESVIAELTRYRSKQEHNQDHDWVLQSKMKPGKRWASHGNSNCSLIEAFKKAGLYERGKLTHEIRRAFASTQLLNGTPIHVVKELLGHSSLKTTELYAFTNDEAKRKAARNALV